MGTMTKRVIAALCVARGCVGEVWSDPVCYRDRAYCEDERAYMLCVSETTGREVAVDDLYILGLCDASTGTPTPVCGIRADAYDDGPYVPFCVR